jgi:hypothetical protein
MVIRLLIDVHIWDEQIYFFQNTTLHNSKSNRNPVFTLAPKGFNLNIS